VRRHVDGAGGENCQVGDEPFDTVLRDKADAVADLDADFDQGGGGAQAFAAVALPAHVVVQAVALEAQGGERPEALGLAAVQSDEIAVVHARSAPGCGACG
jgi:hypothetical protein